MTVLCRGSVLVRDDTGKPKKKHITNNILETLFKR